MPSETDRHYAMGVLAAKKAMSNGNQFSAMVNQAEEVLAKETPEAEAARLRETAKDARMLATAVLDAEVGCMPPEEMRRIATRIIAANPF